MLNRYGKPSKALMDHKRSFFDDNASLVNRCHEIASLYSRQPRRLDCKCCGGKLGPSDFTKQEVPYSVCQICGHLNGLFEDTAEFCDKVYVADDGEDYAKAYSAATADSFYKRVEDIYVPKAQFLKDSLQHHGVNFKSLVYSDLGAGSGYFVAAMKYLGARNVVGLEASASQVALAGKVLGPGNVIGHELSELPKQIRSLETDVVSMIGVLEHVQEPRTVLRAILDNEAIQFLYLSVPLFSPTVFLEMVFPEIFNRQLSAGHTHLFTDSSITYLCNEFGMERLSEWWFGTDMFDLFRFVSVGLELQGFSQQVRDRWQALIAPVLDDLQVVLDRQRLSSEVHLLLSLR